MQITHCLLLIFVICYDFSVVLFACALPPFTSHARRCRSSMAAGNSAWLACGTGATAHCATFNLLGPANAYDTLLPSSQPHWTGGRGNDWRMLLQADYSAACAPLIAHLKQLETDLP